MEKEKIIEKMAEKFIKIQSVEMKTMIMLCMSAYAEGKAAGKAEERLAQTHAKDMASS